MGKNVKDLTNSPGMEELSPPDHIIHLRLANHIHSASFHVSVARTVLLSLILHRIAPKSHPHGEAPLAWRQRCEHNLLAALENNKAAGLQLHVLPAPVTKPPKSGSFPHNGQPRWFVLTALGTLPSGEASLRLFSPSGSLLLYILHLWCCGSNAELLVGLCSSR